MILKNARFRPDEGLKKNQGLPPGPTRVTLNTSLIKM